MVNLYGRLAQSAERQTVNLCVGGSSPPFPATGHITTKRYQRFLPGPYFLFCGRVFPPSSVRTYESIGVFYLPPRQHGLPVLGDGLHIPSRPAPLAALCNDLRSDMFFLCFITQNHIKKRFVINFPMEKTVASKALLGAAEQCSRRTGHSQLPHDATPSGCRKRHAHLAKLYPHGQAASACPWNMLV